MRVRRLTASLFVAVALVAAASSIYVDFKLKDHARRRAQPIASFDLDLELSRPDGRRVRLGALLESRVTVLAFWATWCQACLLEMPLLVRAHRELAAVSFVGINLDEDDAAYRQYLATHGSPFPMLRDPGSQVLDAVGVQVLPTLIVITEQGRVLEKIEGAVSDADLPLFAGRWLAKADSPNMDGS